mmetsp:Transcript_8440/g.12752  ORF Transcript_8440/g.12752 Transcript_8440/m.12752 type:complete len:211 (-) Transcript_8440:15-647(-)
MLSRSLFRIFQSSLAKLSNSPFLEFSDADEAKKQKIVHAYQAYWEHIRFRKGWAKPAFEYEDVKIPMDIAAEYVVQIRKLLDQKNPGMKMRMIDGNAQQYLQSISREDTEVETFIRDLVHSSLKDAMGYVEKLDEDSVDNLLANIELSELTHKQTELLRSKMQLSNMEPLKPEWTVEAAEEKDVPTETRTEEEVESAEEPLQLPQSDRSA